MNDKENFSYNVSWSQVYPEWEKLVEEATEMLLEFSDMEEAKSVISRFTLH